MDSSEDDNDCLITWSSNTEEYSPPSRRVKIEIEKDVNLVVIPGDGHCIANCFAIRFDKPLDMVLDLLDKEFRENISTYANFSEYSEDEILLEVFKYITEKSYDSSTADMFINAFSTIFKTKVVIKYANRKKEDTVIGSNFENNTIHLFKCQDHFDLIVTTPKRDLLASSIQNDVYAEDIVFEEKEEKCIMIEDENYG